ncbi:MAG: CAP domain-containing protein [Pseudomonadota bacterium]
MTRDWDFDDGKNRFSYSDDLFGDGNSGKYARGKYREDKGEDGALKIRLGGKDDADISDMSGGWTKSFEVDEAGTAEVTIRYKMTASGGLDSGEYGELRLAFDGQTYGKNGKDHVAKVKGGDGGKTSTGWQEVTISLGELDAGRHSLDIGGYLNAKTNENERVEVLIDEVSFELEPNSEQLGAFEAEVLDLTNAFRAEHGLDPLQADLKLTAAAEDWSQTMADEDVFEHSDTAAQVEDEGYEWRALGENIAVGYTTPEDVVNGWIGSEGHRANLLNEDFQEIGIGYVYRENDGGDAPYGHYWTQIFGTEADSLI